MKNTQRLSEYMKGRLAVAAITAAFVIAPRPAAAQAVHQRLAPVDLTGNWVSVITEDWHLRMIAPGHGDDEGLPLNDAGKKVLAAWVQPHGAQDACKAYAAPGLLRMPTRLKISWQDGGNTLQIQTDAGPQTRLLHFNGTPPAGAAGLQGYSVATWQYGRGFDPLLPSPVKTPLEQQARAAGGTLKVVTTHLSPGYLRKNGVPFSEQTTLTEYFELQPDLHGNPWFVVTTMVDDPKYLLKDYVTSSNFKKEPDDSKWHPNPCSFE